MYYYSGRRWDGDYVRPSKDVSGEDAPVGGHMEKQEMEMKRKLEMETGNGNRKLKTEMEMQLLRCCSPSKIQLLLSQCSPCLQFLLC